MKLTLTEALFFGDILLKCYINCFGSSVAVLIRWGRWNSYCHMYYLFVNLTVKMASKSTICQR